MSLFHKISSFFMALLVLFSTFSFALESHFCGDVLVDSSILGNVKSCGMNMNETMNMHETSNSFVCAIVEKNCCDDKVVHKKGQDELNSSSQSLSSQQQFFIASLVYSYINLFEGLEDNIIPYRDYKPPLVVRDIQLLDEVFLI